jgi:hypothetical protein
MPQDLRQIAATTAEYEKITTVRVTLEAFLNLQGQALHAASHVGVAGCNPHPTARGNGDQDRNAFNVAKINADGAVAPIRTRASFISTTIAPGPRSLASADIGTGCSTITEAKLGSFAALRASRRHL